MFPLYDHNPPARRPIVTRWLIFLNIAAFVAEYALGGEHGWALQHGFVPARAAQSFLGELPQVLKSMFLHGNVAHLAWNMLFLHIFGDNVEDILGHERYTAFYFFTGIAAAVAQYLIDPTSSVPMVGASGAIAGVLGAYVVLHPRAPIILLNPILPLWLLMGPLLALPAWAVVGYWFLGNLFGGVASLGETGGGVAFFAHLGGFLAGLLLVKPLSIEEPPEPYDDWRGFRTGENRSPRGNSGRAGHTPERRVFWKDDDRPFWR